MELRFLLRILHRHGRVVGVNHVGKKYLSFHLSDKGGREMCPLLPSRVGHGRAVDVNLGDSELLEALKLPEGDCLPRAVLLPLHHDSDKWCIGFYVKKWSNRARKSEQERSLDCISI